MDPTPIIQRAAEFGVVAFLFVIVLLGFGYAIWKIGNKLADATTDSMKRQADAGEKTAAAVEKIGDLTSAIQQQGQQFTLQLSTIGSKVNASTRALRHITDALAELTPTECPPRVREYLTQARQALERVDT